jgi:hypothetical protein
VAVAAWMRAVIAASDSRAVEQDVIGIGLRPPAGTTALPVAAAALAGSRPAGHPPLEAPDQKFWTSIEFLDLIGTPHKLVR